MSVENHKGTEDTYAWSEIVSPSVQARDGSGGASSSSGSNSSSSSSSSSIVVVVVVVVVVVAVVLDEKVLFCFKLIE
ncbi:hypothetical protein ElyMa_000350200 [Elysia marginata]|uniref:Uncharacterized protein n=1 Tax=Elysia marginata TaxID=1093978 RepID=A0AAV4FDF2_9GAST|nr:hypothetical protein ElyMa_000350200 [Elysia marginata]